MSSCALAGQTSSRKFGQPTALAGSDWMFSSPCWTPSAKNAVDQTFLCTPGSPLRTPRVKEVLLGEREYGRSCQVISGTIASTRLSCIATANWIWPP